MATRTVVAGGGNYNATGTWVEGAVPTAADDVVTDGSSSGTLVVNVASVCRSITIGNGVNVTHTSTLAVGDGSGGALNYTGAGTISGTGAVSFVSTSDNGGAGWGVTSAGKTMPALTFNGAGGKWVLQDALTAALTITLTSGTLDTNSQTIIGTGLVVIGAVVRTLTLGSSTITLSGTNVTAFQTTTNLTVTANTATITYTANAILPNYGTFNYNGLSVAFTGAGACGFGTSSGNPTLANVTRTGTAIKTDEFQVHTNGLTVTGTLTINGNSSINRVRLRSSTTGTAATINAAALSMSNVDVMDITGAGAASWDLSAITGLSGDCQGNSGITFTAALDRYAVVAGNWSSTATWADTSGGAGGTRVPLPQDNVFLDASSAATTYTADMPRLGKDINCTGFTRTITRGITLTIYGSLTLSAGMTWTNTLSGAVLAFGGRGSHTITSAGHVMDNRASSNGGTSFFAPGGTYTLQDAYVGAGYNTGGTTVALSVSFGTLDLNGQSVTVGRNTNAQAVSVSAGATLITGGSTITLRSNNSSTFTIVAVNIGATITDVGGTWIINDASSATRTFAGGGKIYGTLTYTVAGSTGTLSVTGQNTFNTINFSDASNARTLSLPTTVVTTITNLFNVNGTAGKLMGVIGDVASTVQQTCDYLSVSSSDATGTVWYAGANSTDGGSNTGWTFKSPVGDTLEAVWVVRTTIGDQIEAQWQVFAAAGRSLTAIWAVTAAPPVVLNERIVVLLEGSENDSNPYFLIDQGDTAPTLDAALVNIFGNLVDISDLSVDFKLYSLGGALVFSRPATIVDGPDGHVRYVWQAGDTATAGRYLGKFVVTSPGPVTQEFPQNRHIRVRVA